MQRSRAVCLEAPFDTLGRRVAVFGELVWSRSDGIQYGLASLSSYLAVPQ